jgi:hypothetical protein
VNPSEIRYVHVTKVQQLFSSQIKYEILLEFCSMTFCKYKTIPETKDRVSCHIPLDLNRIRCMFLVSLSSSSCLGP